VVIVLALASASCSKEERVRTLDEAHETSVEHSPVHLNVPTDERLGIQRPGKPKTSSPLTWTTPAGWTEMTPTAMRAASFRVAGDERAECYLTLLGGDAGGLGANVDRWRKQMSLSPSTPQELAALEHCKLLGKDAVFLDLSGKWTGMNGAAAQDGYRLIGALLVDASGSAFLKMVGPSAVIDGQIENFKALAGSFRNSP
jgi:hypothetical protein